MKHRLAVKPLTACIRMALFAMYGYLPQGPH